MQFTQQETLSSKTQDKRYEPNDDLLETLHAMKQEVESQSDDYRGQLEAIFKQHRDFG